MKKVFTLYILLFLVALTGSILPRYIFDIVFYGVGGFIILMVIKMIEDRI